MTLPYALSGSAQTSTPRKHSRVAKEDLHSVPEIRTLHITNSFHQSSGGIATFYRAMLRTADETGRQMTLIVPSDRDEIESAGKTCRIYHVRSPRVPAFDRRYRFISPAEYVWSKHSRLGKAFAAETPDLIEVCDKYGLLFLPSVIRQKWLPLNTEPTLVGLSCERMDDNVSAYIGRHPVLQAFSRWYVEHAFLPRFDFVIANSNYTAEELRQARHAPAVYAVPMGVDSQRFSRGLRSRERRLTLCRRFSLAPLSRLVVYAGRLSPEKYVDVLIRAIRDVRLRSAESVHLLVFGDGPSLGELRSLATKLTPLGVTFAGHRNSRDEMAELFANCDVFVHTNPREPFGIAPLEAMASGIPVVLPDSGGVLSYASRENAWLTPMIPDRLADTILNVLSQPPLALENRLLAARSTAESLDWMITTRSLFNLYDRLRARHLLQHGKA